MALGWLFYLVAFVCWLVVLIDAFKNEVWKGIVGLVCGLYLLYYGIVEFQNPKKPIILAGWILCGVVGWGLIMAGGGNFNASIGTPPR